MSTSFIYHAFGFPPQITEPVQSTIRHSQPRLRRCNQSHGRPPYTVTTRIPPFLHGTVTAVYPIK